jgi:hypothetical protein
VIPKQPNNAYFHAVFVFDGENAPSMSVVSLSKDVSIGVYSEWKDMVKPFIIFVLLSALFYVIIKLYDRWDRARLIGRFSQHATELRKRGELKSTDEQAIGDAITIYSSFLRRKTSKVLPKLFGTSVS